jgi:threonine dehydrogenase-like Zn-dependent dehydrogenase
VVHALPNRRSAQGSSRGTASTRHTRTGRGGGAAVGPTWYHVHQTLSIGTGQCLVTKYNRYLRDLIIRGQANPSMTVSHGVSLDDAVYAYDKLDKRVDGYTKVLLHPAA